MEDIGDFVVLEQLVTLFCSQVLKIFISIYILHKPRIYPCKMLNKQTNKKKTHGGKTGACNRCGIPQAGQRAF